MMTLQQLDMSILLWIQEHLRIAALTPFWKVITFLGNGGWFWLVAAAVLLIPKKTRRVGITALLSITIGFLITNVLLKNIVARPRPFDAYTEIIPLITRPTDFSFRPVIHVHPLRVRWFSFECCQRNMEFRQ